MLKPDVRKQYIPTIGIECHVQFNTTTKLFSGALNDARQAAPNSLISHIDLGMPGALPVLNARAVDYAILAALALGTEPQPFSTFDRKHYFYPDLPMGYQITQFYHPIIRNGQLTIEVNGQAKTIGIHEAHLEADAGKSTHPAGKDYSLVDLNRAGTPLLEIVSAPDMHSATEAKAYARELYLLVKYLGISDASLYYGNMRFDVNVSVSKDPAKLGTRTETKNLNSFRSIEKAVEYEVNRQIELLEKGQPITQETRGWNDAKQKTFSQRSKEEAHDYRYMPDPDIPPIELTPQMIEPLRKSLPTLPAEWRQRLQSLGLDTSQVDSLLEAQVEIDNGYLGLIEANLNHAERAKSFANWIVNIELPLQRAQAEANQPLTISAPKRRQVFSEVFELFKAGKITSNHVKSLLTELLTSATLPPSIEQYANQQGYIQLTDESAIDKIAQQVIASNPQAAADVQNGEMKAIGFLVGQVMKLSQGKANPTLAQQLLKKHLGV